MKKYYKDNAEVFGLISDWESLWQNYTHFEQEYSDPSRFKSRNYSSLFEERERKRYNNELPKVRIFFTSIKQFN